MAIAIEEESDKSKQGARLLELESHTRSVADKLGIKEQLEELPKASDGLKRARKSLNRSFGDGDEYDLRVEGFYLLRNFMRVLRTPPWKAQALLSNHRFIKLVNFCVHFGDLSEVDAIRILEIRRAIVGLIKAESSSVSKAEFNELLERAERLPKPSSRRYRKGRSHLRLAAKLKREQEILARFEARERPSFYSVLLADAVFREGVRRAASRAPSKKDEMLYLARYLELRRETKRR